MSSTSLRGLIFLPLLFAARTTLAQASFDPAARAAAVAPFLDEQTLVVGRVDLKKIDAAAAVKLLGELAPEGDVEFPKQLAAIEQKAKEMLRVLTEAGFSELYVVMSLADFPKEPLFVVAPVKVGSDAQKAAGILRETIRMEAADVRPSAAVVGTSAIIERLKKLQPVRRPELAKGFEKAGDTAAQLIFSPNADTRRVLREMLPRLPDEIGGGSGRMLADGVQWAVLSVDLPPRLAFSLTIQSKDADSAAAIRGIVVSSLALLREDRGVQKIPQLDDVIRLLTPRLSGDQLVIAANDATAKTLLNVLVPAVQAARIAAGRAQSMNYLKQLGLAMHNYHDTHNHFPPQAVRSKEGKPLLSWRVALLPFLQADALYKEFHLDEPWDSEHNKRLIEKMPAVFASPHLGDARRAQGQTSYLVPLSKAPPAVFTPPKPAPPGAAPAAAAAAGPEMVFDNLEGTAISKITDGTSNTVLIVEVHPTAAVAWTKPDDLVIDEKDPFKNLRDQPNVFNALFCDGSVRSISYNVDPKLLLRLLQMNDGQPISGF